MTAWCLVLLLPIRLSTHSQLFVPCAVPREGHRTALPMRQSPENWHPQALLLSAGRTRGTFIIKGNRTRSPVQFNKIIENYLMQGVQWPISVWLVARGLWVHRHWLWKDVWLFPRKHRWERAELAHVCGMRDSEHGLGQGWIRDTVAVWPTMTAICLGWFIAVIYFIHGKLVGNDPTPSGGLNVDLKRPRQWAPDSHSSFSNFTQKGVVTQGSCGKGRPSAAPHLKELTYTHNIISLSCKSRTSSFIELTV